MLTEHSVPNTGSFSWSFTVSKYPRFPKTTQKKKNSTHICFLGLCVFSWESVKERRKCSPIFSFVSQLIKDWKCKISSLCSDASPGNSRTLAAAPGFCYPPLSPAMEDRAWAGETTATSFCPISRAADPQSCPRVSVALPLCLPAEGPVRTQREGP